VKEPFALELVQIRTRSTLRLSMSEEANYHQVFAQRVAAFLATLWRAYPDIQLEIGILFDPKHEAYPIRFFLLGFTKHKQNAVAPMLDLLHATFHEFEAKPVAVAEARVDYPEQQADVWQLYRRWLNLEDEAEIKPAKPIGFQRGTAKTKSVDEEVWLIPQLQPGKADWVVFCELILRQPHPLGFSVRLEPTKLNPEEEVFLEQQLKHCDDLSEREQRSVLGQIATQAYSDTRTWLLSLRTFSVLGDITIASNRVLSPTLLQSFVRLVSGSQAAETPAFESANVQGNLKRQILQAFQSPFSTRFEIRQSEQTPEHSGQITALFDAREAAALFLWPFAPVEPLPGVPCRHWRDRPLASPNIKGLKIGSNRYRGVEHSIEMSPEDLKRHMYVVGQTGSGKTTFLNAVALSIIKSGMGMCLLDPHGDLLHTLMGQLPEERLEDVIVIDPADPEYSVNLNLLECESQEQRYHVAQQVVEFTRLLVEDEFEGDIATFAGPVFFEHVKRNLLHVMSDPAEPGTLLQFIKIFETPGFWKRWMPLKTNDYLLQQWVTNTLMTMRYWHVNSDGNQWSGYVTSKFQGLVTDPRLRDIFGSPRSTINFSKAMNERKIILVNLSKGVLGIGNSRLLGLVVMSQLYTAALERVKLPLEERNDFVILVDEFQSLVTRDFMNLFSEGRKFGVCLVLANQFLSQIRDKRIIQAAVGNAGTLVAFRLGYEDAATLENEFYPSFSRFDLLNVSNWRACVRALRNGQKATPFTLEIDRPEVAFDAARINRIIAHSRKHFCLPRVDIQKIISESLEYVVPPTPAEK
jgi:energy-coupling factor transporter ATP-binding protein EcfA2